jgi:aminoglycoside/choline kinase family phosphotransferase/dTDP-glucose pyrophosphorylase
MTMPSHLPARLPMPHRAVILAAGLGTRLRPLTWFLPKPLLPVAGEPLIVRTLRLLSSWGVTDAAVNLHWQAGMLRERLGNSAAGVRLTYSVEPLLLGTGGALRALAAFIGAAEPFWLVNADILVARLDPAPLWQAFDNGRRLAAAWLVPAKGPRTVETDAEGRIVSFRSSPAHSRAAATFAGLQVVAPRILRHVPDRNPCTLVEIYEAARRAGECVAGVRAAGAEWDDIGTQPRYLAAVRRFPRTAGPAPAAGASTAAFSCRPRGRPAVQFSALFWPDPALAPLLAALRWPLTGTWLEALGARGSDRTFARLRAGRRRAIYVRYGVARTENARYAPLAGALRQAGVPVPRVLTFLPEARALALEDWGGVSLQRLMARQPADAAGLYNPVLQAAARLHGEATPAVIGSGVALEPPFDADTYRWERELFVIHLLRGRLRLPDPPPGVLAELESVARRLLAGPRTLVHRDLQSSNVLCRGNRIALIDFQGMRLGHPAYDLASLLYDPYVGLDSATRDRLLQRYREYATSECRAAGQDLPWAAVQRLTQALGAYARLAALGLTGFAAYIGPAALSLGSLATTCGLPAMAALAAAIAQHEKAGGA